jgi:hypothetical protein
LDPKSANYLYIYVKINLLFFFVKINHRMGNKAAMASTGSSTYTSGMQVGFIGVGIINSLMVLTC